MSTKYYVVAPLTVEWAIAKDKVKDFQYYTFPKEHPPVICTNYAEARGWVKEFLKFNKKINYGIFELKFESFWNDNLDIPVIKSWTDQNELIPQGPI